MQQILIYGATGYTGQLIAEHAVAQGLRPVLAARNSEKLRVVADRFGLDERAFGLESPAAIADGIRGVGVVLHAAGPFSATSRPMVEACLRTRVHYIDITGEVSVFESLASRDREAAEAGVMLLPGAGFDVVPSDCLAAHVKQRLPDAMGLKLSIGGLGRVSRGTAKTMVESLGRGTLVRRDGRIVEADTPPLGTADFGNGPKSTIGVSWGDVSTAWHSTGIANIEVLFEATPGLQRAAKTRRFWRRVLGTRLVQRLLKRTIDRRLPPGPTPEQRKRYRSVLIAEAWNAAGARAASRLETVEGYTLTSWTAVEIARRAADGQARPGYETPATAFGADFILSFDSTRRYDD